MFNLAESLPLESFCRKVFQKKNIFYSLRICLIFLSLRLFHVVLLCLGEKKTFKILSENIFAQNLVINVIVCHRKWAYILTLNVMHERRNVQQCTKSQQLTSIQLLKLFNPDTMVCWWCIPIHCTIKEWHIIHSHLWLQYILILSFIFINIKGWKEDKK